MENIAVNKGKESVSELGTIKKKNPRKLKKRAEPAINPTERNFSSIP